MFKYALIRVRMQKDVLYVRNDHAIYKINHILSKPTFYPSRPIFVNQICLVYCLNVLVVYVHKA